MNSTAHDMYYPSHLSAGPAGPTQASPAPLNHYAQHPQSSILPPGPAHYNPAPQHAYSYPYGNGMPSPQSGHVGGAPLGGPNVLPLPAMASQPGMPGGPYGGPHGFDTTGQIAPPGMKPRVTATLWEDEGSLCFQVEAKGICVARREDNHMINGTKLLNVAGMTRGRRDGILKSEKMRHVVKIGPMHLKGVWIPFERALDFANKEKITEMLYPLFVHNIGALLYHPTNQPRHGQPMAATAADRRKQDAPIRNPPPQTSLPSMQSQQQQQQQQQAPHHHAHMNGSMNGALPGSQHLAPRPGMDRAHTFPTPPTSASSVIGGMGSSDGSFGWAAPGMGSVPGPNLSIDTGLGNQRSMPTTPASTPPGTSMQSMQQYQSNGPSYDAPRQSMYSAAPAQPNAYAQAPPPSMSRYGQQSGAYVKNDMGPPLNRTGEVDHPDTKDASLLHHAANGHSHEEHDEHEQHDYSQENGQGYDAHRGTYSYSNGPSVAALPTDHGHLAPEMTGSPNHPASGRATPRTASTNGAAYYGQQAGYTTPPRHQPPSSNLYNVMSSERGTANGTMNHDGYGAHSDLSNSMSNGYPAVSVVNGAASAGNKRAREDDEDQRPSSRGPASDMDGLKRRKTIREGSASGPAYDTGLNRSRSIVGVAPQRRR